MPEISIRDDLLNGAAEIADFLGWPVHRVYHAAPYLPIKRLGPREIDGRRRKPPLIARKSELARALSAAPLRLCGEMRVSKASRPAADRPAHEPRTFDLLGRLIEREANLKASKKQRRARGAFTAARCWANCDFLIVGAAMSTPQRERLPADVPAKSFSSSIAASPTLRRSVTSPAPIGLRSATNEAPAPRTNFAA